MFRIKCLLSSQINLNFRSRYSLFVNRKYTNEHEWVTYQTDTSVARVGITKYAQEELGDIVHIEMPKIGLKFQKQGVVGAIESVKVAADIYAPISGEILYINEDVKENPSIVNEDAETNWIFEAKIANLEELDSLMSQQQYDDFVSSLHK